MGRPPRRIFRDISDPSILIGCNECPWWFAMRFDLLEAYRVGERHEIEVHGVPVAEAAKPRIRFEHRHAGTG